MVEADDISDACEAALVALTARLRSPDTQTDADPRQYVLALTASEVGR